MTWWCPDINNGLYVTKESSTEVKLGLCCISALSPKSTEVNFNDSWLIDQRTQNPPPACKICLTAEANGTPSRRQGIIEFYQTIDTQLTPNSIVNLDYNCENVCNAKCIMCNGVYSSLWVEDEVKLGLVQPMHKKTKHNSLIYNLDFSNLRRLHFNGGEPLLSKDHLIVLEKVINSGAAPMCQLSYNTNGSVIPSKEVLNLWRKFKLVKLQFSIDAIGSAFDYIRFPLKWDQLLDNFEFWKNFNEFNILYSLNITLGLHNILYLEDLLKWCLNNFSTNKQTDPVEIDIQHVHHTALNLENLPYNHRPIAQAIIQNLDKKYAGLASYFANTNKPNNDWVCFLNSLDQIRNTNWKDSLSRLV